MVAFHGDEGDPASYIEYAMPEETGAAGYMLLSLKCPRDLGCGGSWYSWRGSRSYDSSWVESQVEAVEAEYNVDLNRVYLGGFSGGAYFLASYAPVHTDRFAGVLYMGGGSGSQDGCPSCKMPAYFLLGGGDFGHISPARDTESFFRDCGHEVEFQTVAGLGHRIAESKLNEVYTWFDTRPHQCRTEPEPTPPPTSPGPAVDGGTSAPGPIDPGGNPGTLPPPKVPEGEDPVTTDGGPGARSQPEGRAYLQPGCQAAGPPRAEGAFALGVLVGLTLLASTTARRRRYSDARKS